MGGIRFERSESLFTHPVTLFEGSRLTAWGKRMLHYLDDRKKYNGKDNES